MAGIDLEHVDEDWERALAIVAHPDDLEYGAASAIARWSAQGKQVAYVIVSSGEAGIDTLAPGEAATVREDEERTSAAAVGVKDIAFLHCPDGLIEYGLALRAALVAQIRRVRPHVLLTMNFELTWPGADASPNHADHRAVGLATLDAARDAANRWLFADAGAPWSGASALYVFGASAPTHFVDVAGSIDAGVASLRAHRRYLEGLGTDFDPDAFLRESAAAAGALAGCEAAVLFGRFGLG